jgi:hypothetical protein
MLTNVAPSDKCRAPKYNAGGLTAKMMAWTKLHGTTENDHL